MQQDLNIIDRNTEMPFFPSITWSFLNSDIITTLPGNFVAPFTWIQAFFDPTLSVAATLAIWNGLYQSDGVTPMLNGIRFAYSGERINIKGIALFSTGTDRRGATVTSVPIGSSLTTQLSQVIAYGGMY